MTVYSRDASSSDYIGFAILAKLVTGRKGSHLFLVSNLLAKEHPYLRFSVKLEFN